MKALLLSAIVFFSLRAMADVNDSENQKTPCPYANQQANRNAKVIASEETSPTVPVKSQGLAQ